MNYTKKQKKEFLKELLNTYEEFLNRKAIYDNTIDDDILDDFLRKETLKAMKHEMKQQQQTIKEVSNKIIT